MVWYRTLCFAWKNTRNLQKGIRWSQDEAYALFAVDVLNIVCMFTVFRFARFCSHVWLLRKLFRTGNFEKLAVDNDKYWTAQSCFKKFSIPFVLHDLKLELTTRLDCSANKNNNEIWIRKIIKIGEISMQRKKVGRPQISSHNFREPQFVKNNYQPLFKYRKPVRTPPACDASGARSDQCGILGSLTGTKRGEK